MNELAQDPQLHKHIVSGSALIADFMGSDDFEKIKQFFTDNYLYEDKIISIERCWVD